MSCEPRGACGPDQPDAISTPARPPGLADLGYRVGSYDRFRRALARSGQESAGLTSGAERWDLEADPHAGLLLSLWAYMAETVNGALELAANESFLPTSRSADDLQQVVALVGVSPRPRVAATGWIRIETDALAAPVIPAGTQVQAPAAPPVRLASQTFEVIEDVQVHPDLADLTATQLPVITSPAGQVLRFLGDPNFGIGDLVVFVDETNTKPTFVHATAFLLNYGWFGMRPMAPQVTPIMVARVIDRSSELGTTLITFDRPLDALDTDDSSYACYRVRATAGTARRMSPPPVDPPVEVSGAATSAITPRAVVLDVVLDEISAGSTVVIADWGAPTQPTGTVHAVERAGTVGFAPVQGSVTRLTKVWLSEGHGLDAATSSPTVYLVDRRVPVFHHDFPDAALGTSIRIFPCPQTVPTRLAIGVDRDGSIAWELVRVEAAEKEVAPSGLDGSHIGMNITLAGPLPAGDLHIAPANGNVARIRHGVTEESALGDGDQTLQHQVLVVPDAPVTADLDSTGAPRLGLEVQVDGRRWDPVGSLYGHADDEVYRPVLDASGNVRARFGARLPTGRANVRARYRIGGGRVGEVDGNAIDTLLGSIDGVRGVAGTGRTTGGADQSSASDLRRVAPGRARAFDRVVSVEDAIDLALGFPGVSHATAWRGSGPDDANRMGAGVHLVFLRAATDGVRVPMPAEVSALQTYLDARRDLHVPLSVGPGKVVPVTVTATIVADPRRDPAVVAAAARQALLDPIGPLDPSIRALGQVLDRSDVVELIHRTTGVVGVTSFGLVRVSGASSATPQMVGRLEAARDELLLIQQVDFSGERA